MYLRYSVVSSSAMYLTKPLIPSTSKHSKGGNGVDQVSVGPDVQSRPTALQHFLVQRPRKKTRNCGCSHLLY